MNKIKTFFAGFTMLAIVFAMLLVSALIYSAIDNSGVKSYIFQTGDLSKDRIGQLESLNDISADDLRNKLIKKYVSEYFKIIPGDTDMNNRTTLKDLSASSSVYQQWLDTEAETIEKLSRENVFRIAKVDENGIAPYNKTNKDKDESNKLYYIVRYHTFTWLSSNLMGTKPEIDSGTLYLEIHFKPELLNETDIQYDLKTGKNPASLFKFEVTSIKRM